MNFERLRNIDYFTEFYCDQRIKYKIEETRPVNGFDQFSINYAIDWGTKNHNIKKWMQFKPSFPVIYLSFTTFLMNGKGDKWQQIIFTPVFVFDWSERWNH